MEIKLLLMKNYRASRLWWAKPGRHYRKRGK